jgi:hypothetical protein
MNRMLNLRAATTAAAVISHQAALAQPVPLRKEHAYTGPHRSLAQLAMVHGTILTSWPLVQTHPCDIDGKSYRAMFAVEICPVDCLPAAGQSSGGDFTHHRQLARIGYAFRRPRGRPHL